MTGETVTHSEAARTQRILDALADVGLGELLGFDAFSHVDADTLNMAIEEFVHFSEHAVAPTDRDGDRIGCAFDVDTASVRTAPGSIEAYGECVAGGWGAVAVPRDVGGAGYPKVVGAAMQEVLASANLGLSLCPALTQDAIEVLSRWGSDAQREVYVPKLLTGEWNGTMQMTEADAGSDVGAIRTEAEPLPDGRYALHGTKIFISWGEHDLTDNIVHLVLARTPGSPAGTHGLSLFVVPKFHVQPDGTPGERNGVWCRSRTRWVCTPAPRGSSNSTKRSVNSLVSCTAAGA